MIFAFSCVCCRSDVEDWRETAGSQGDQGEGCCPRWQPRDVSWQRAGLSGRNGEEKAFEKLESAGPGDQLDESEEGGTRCWALGCPVWSGEMLGPFTELRNGGVHFREKKSEYSV